MPVHHRFTDVSHGDLVVTGDPDVLRVAWAAMTRFVDAEGVGMLFGCSSFLGTDAETYLDAFAMLRERHLAPKCWRPVVKAPKVFPFALRLRRRQSDPRRAMQLMPPLLRTYLMMGGWVSDHAVVDDDLGTLHVFTGVDSQLDRGVDESQCTTYFEGEGCYTDDSYIARWIDAFWGDWIDDIDPQHSDDEAAYDRCVVDPSFLGSYAATNPEEDFAETFSAYVFSVPVEDPGLVAKYDFMDADPYLRSFKQRIEDAGIEPLPNQFEGCGF